MPMCGCTRLPCPWTHRYRRQRDHFVPSSTPFLARFGLEALATVRVEEDTGTVPRSVTGSVAFRRSGLSSSNGRLVRNRPFAHSAKFSGHKGAGKAGRRLRPQHRVQWIEKNAHGFDRYSQDIPAFPAQWFYGLYVLSPGKRPFLPPLPAGLTADVAPGSRRQDHTTSPTAAAFSSGGDHLTPQAAHRNPHHVP